MRATMQKTLTPFGVARLMARGIRANFAPEHQDAEAGRMVEYLQDLAMSRGMMSELPNTPLAGAQRAREDAVWLEALADELDAIRDVQR